MRERRGNVTMVALLFGTLLGFSALSVDVGLIRVAGTEIQVVLDAAALSGASTLDGTEAGIDRARSVAVDVASRNNVLGQGVTLPAAEVVIGAWDPDTATFTAYRVGDDPATINTVRIAHTPPSFASGLGGVAFGAVGYTVDAQSMAMRELKAGPASSTKCFLPLAVPDCHLASAPPGANPPPMKFTFNPSPTDAIAWANPSANPNTAWIRDQLADPCAGGNEVRVGQNVQVNEGVHNSALQTVRDIINTTGVTTWDPVYGPLPLRDGVSANDLATSDVTRYGHTLEGAVALVDGGPDCSAVSFSGPLRTTGIGWAVIYDVSAAGGDKNLWIQLDVVGEHDIWGDTDDAATGLNVLGVGTPELELW
ncbi:MAG: pilus assembly protein TadG-related protein [Myxococcota bacterium]